MSGITVNRASLRHSLQEGINAIVGTAFKQRPEQWKQLYTTENSKKAYETLVMRVGLGGMQKKQEGGPVNYDAGNDAWNYVIRHETWALAFAITEEAVEDNLYGDIAKEYGAGLAASAIHAHEINAMIPINYATDANFVKGDGVTLLNTAHPLWYGGTYANRPTTLSQLGEMPLVDAITTMSLWKNERGIPTIVQPKALCIHPSNWAVAQRLTMDDKRVGTANNDSNVVKGQFSSVNQFHYLSNPNMWFLTTDAEKGFIHFQRAAPKKGMEGDFETGNMRYKFRERYSYDVFNPRAIYGDPGA